MLFHRLGVVFECTHVVKDTLSWVDTVLKPVIQPSPEPRKGEM